MARRPFWGARLWEQGFELSGVVRGVDGSPLEGASVTLPCQKVAVSTDANGRYRFSLPASARGHPIWMYYRAIGYRRVTDSVRVTHAAAITKDQVMQKDVMQLNQVVVTNSDAAGYSSVQTRSTGNPYSESITNTQHAEVDEGGIVKVHGEHLVVLRRGRLFTVRVGDDALAPVAMVDAYPPDITRRGGWYDELVIHGDRAVVVGYSYARRATEINLFRLDARGGIRYETTYHLRSNDYYSSRNYSTRVVQGTLFLYTPLFVYAERDPLPQLPAIRQWRSPADTGAFTRIATPDRVHYVRGALARGDQYGFHAITRCDLASEPLRCEARVIIAPPGEVVYVSPSAVYLWTTDGRRQKADGGGRKSDDARSLVMRLPLDGGAPSGIRASGSPVDQFSFDEADGMLSVLVDATGTGDWMWSAERRPTKLRLARIRIASLGDGTRVLPASAWRSVPDPGPGALVNRFVGLYLIYGGGQTWDPAKVDPPHRVVLVPVRGGAPSVLTLGHRVDRIERMGDDAVVVGGDGDDLFLTAVRLADEPRLAQQYVVKDAAQAESRSHGFFYRPTDASTGLLGLPIAGAGRRTWQQLRHGAAEVLFVRNEGDAFAEAGSLDARSGKEPPDDCVASCADWYGNARPIFLRGRVYALMGYEIVEGREVDGRVQEVRRVQFLPRKGEVGGPAPAPDP